MTKHNLSNSAQVYFNCVSVDYHFKPKWLGGKPFKALDKLDLSIETQNVAIVGPSGAGKSTLIELLFGLREPSSGEVIVCGHALTGLSSKRRKELSKHIQLIPQEPKSSLNPYYTVSEVLAEPLLNLGVAKVSQRQLEQAVVNVGLDKSLLNRNSQQLSIGQAQRVAIARALIVEPCVLVADEPTSSLDPVSRQQILALLKRLQSKYDMRLILVTHDLDAAQQLCDEIVVLNRGQVVEHAPASTILHQPKHAVTQALITAQFQNSKLTQTIGEVFYVL